MPGWCRNARADCVRWGRCAGRDGVWLAVFWVRGTCCMYVYVNLTCRHPIHCILQPSAVKWYAAARRGVPDLMTNQTLITLLYTIYFSRAKHWLFSYTGFTMKLCINWLHDQCRNNMFTHYGILIHFSTKRLRKQFLWDRLWYKTTATAMLVKWNRSYIALNQIRGSLFPSKEEKNNSLVNNIRQSSGVLYFIYLWYNLNLKG